MFAKGGGVPGLKKGFSFTYKGKPFDLSDNLKDFIQTHGVEGLEWLQRKIYGGSIVPDKWKQNQAEIWNRQSGAIDDDFVGPVLPTTPKKIDTKKITGNNLVKALKWGNEGFFNPAGYVPKVWPVPFRPLRTKDAIDMTGNVKTIPDEGLGGWGKEVIKKGFKTLTASGVYSAGREYLKPESVKEMEENIKELENKGVNPEWALDQDSLPVKTFENKVLEKIPNVNLGKGPGENIVLKEKSSNLKNDDIDDSNMNVVETKTAATNGNEDVNNFNTPPDQEEINSGNVIDMTKYDKAYKDNNKETNAKISEPIDLKETTFGGNEDWENQVAADKLIKGMNDGLMNLEADDLSEIQQYIGLLQGIMGKGDPMIQAGLLMQLGTSLMNAETTERGLAGFLQAAGQAGQKIAPSLMKLGQKRDIQKQNLAGAALQLYMDKVKQSRPSGAPYMVAKIKYGQNEAGETVALGIEPAKMYQLNSDEFRNAMAEDNAYYQQFNRPKYYFGAPGDPGTSTIFQGSVPGITGDAGQLQKITAQDDFQQTGTYMHNILDVSVPFLSELIDKPWLLGASGVFAEKGAGFKATFEDVAALVSGEIPNWEDSMGMAFQNVKDSYLNPDDAYWRATGVNYKGLVNRPADPDYKMDLGGQMIPVFVDWNNDFGMNAGGITSTSRDTSLIGINGIRSYMVKEGFDKFFDTSTIGRMDLVSRTIGIGFSRSRQPTGRMLADVLQGSLKDAKYTGIGSDPKADRWAVLTAHVEIINQLYDKVDTAYGNAGISNLEDVSNKLSVNYNSDLRYIAKFSDQGRWKIRKLREFANKYYTLKESLNPELPELNFYTYQQWKNDGDVQLQNSITQQDNEKSTVTDSILDQFDKGLDFMLGGNQ